MSSSSRTPKEPMQTSSKTNVPGEVSGGTALVLSGGGARGAYEVGVISGIFKVLQNKIKDPQIFNLFCGTSVGALNASWLAAHAHEPEMAIEKLISVWRSITIDTHLKPTIARFLFEASFKKNGNPKLGRSLLDIAPLENIIFNQIDWNALHQNTKQGLVQALIITALEISTGRTTMFTELAPNRYFRPSRDSRRILKKEPITPDHVLASSAIPLVFPARKIDNQYYCDGGLRFNTPIAPAIRSGANKLVIIPLLYQDGIRTLEQSGLDSTQAYPSPIFLLGKILNALLLDPVHYDLQVLQRFNQLLDTFENTLDPNHLKLVHETIAQARGTTYRPVQTLVIKPSDSLGHLASERVKELERSKKAHWLLKRIAKMGSSWESDFLSFVLFDEQYIDTLIDLGEKDALSQHNEILDFFISKSTIPKSLYNSQYPNSVQTPDSIS